MSTPNTSNFLRRTAVALAAVAGLAISLPGFAQGNSLKKSTGEAICTYTELKLTPSGGVTVTCEGSTTTPPPVTPGAESFAITGSPSSLTVGTAALILVTRLNGTATDVAINYTITGGCSPASGTFWIGQVRATEGFQIVAPSAATTCVATLSGPTVGAIGSPGSVSIPVIAGPSTPTQPGCPTPPNDVVDFDLKLSGADRLQMESGRIAAAVLPKVSDTRPIGASGQIIFGEATISPRAATVEVSVTKCRGVMDTGAGLCYVRLTNGSFMKLEWIEKPIWGASTDGVATAYKLCKAYQTEGPFYVNVRYTYSPADCTWGGTCGYTDQWNYAAY